MLPKLSYIVPAYNAENTLTTFFEKIYAVDMPQDEFEVIVVDDCSTDSTWNLLEEYAAKYPNIVILHQEHNQRQGAARNRAIAVAKGEYITCADIDDWVEQGIVDALKEALHLKVDVLICQTQFVSNTGQKVYLHLDKDEHRVLTGEQFLNEHYHWHIPGAPWGYLIRREYMMRDYVPFVENRFHEDNDWILRIVYNAKVVKVDTTLIYSYIENQVSTIHSNTSIRMADEVHAAYRIFLFLESLPDSSKPFIDACREDRSYTVDNYVSRLWKTPDGRYIDFYRRLEKEGIEGCLNLGDIHVYSGMTKFMLKFPNVSTVLLYTIAPLARLLKHLRNK